MDNIALNNLFEKVKDEKVKGNYDLAYILSSFAIFNGVITSPNGSGTAVLQIGTNSMKQINDLMNIFLLTGVKSNVEIYQIFKVVGNTFYSEVFIEIEGVSEMIIKSNSIQYIKGMHILYVGAYFSDYLLGKN